MMKILTAKKQDKIAELVYELQLSIYENNFIKSTDLLCELAGDLLDIKRLISIQQKLEKADR